ncbi:MAG: hypothetical protein AMJ56_13165 [Anaerolineae bacterium SG8_19]|jgi:hypothetical protein|nr:MAG: hypothetical protein AMJ56_13165 [Anaerolineae bacterium SG8_19]HCB49760.1 hypothetical protein [Chloroflexota bacterium]
MKPLTFLAIVIGLIGVLCLFLGQWLSLDILTYAGFGLMGLVAIVIGLEALITRRLVQVSRYSRRANETYVGVAAIAQGVIFIIMGLFFIGIAFAAYMNSGRELFLHFIRHPGLALLVFGLFLLMMAISAIAGTVEDKEGGRFEVYLTLLTSRLLPGLILLALAAGAFGLGLLEITSPQAFDQMGGGFLEVLFGG